MKIKRRKKLNVKKEDIRICCYCNEYISNPNITKCRKKNWRLTNKQFINKEIFKETMKTAIDCKHFSMNKDKRR